MLRTASRDMGSSTPLDLVTSRGDITDAHRAAGDLPGARHRLPGSDTCGSQSKTERDRARCHLNLRQRQVSEQQRQAVAITLRRRGLSASTIAELLRAAELRRHVLGWPGEARHRRPSARRARGGRPSDVPVLGDSPRPEAAASALATHMPRPPVRPAGMGRRGRSGAGVQRCVHVGRRRSWTHAADLAHTIRPEADRGPVSPVTGTTTWVHLTLTVCSQKRSHVHDMDASRRYQMHASSTPPSSMRH